MKKLDKSIQDKTCGQCAWSVDYGQYSVCRRVAFGYAGDQDGFMGQISNYDPACPEFVDDGR